MRNTPETRSQAEPESVVQAIWKRYLSPWLAWLGTRSASGRRPPVSGRKRFLFPQFLPDYEPFERRFHPVDPFGIGTGTLLGINTAYIAVALKPAMAVVNPYPTDTLPARGPAAQAPGLLAEQDAPAFYVGYAPVTVAAAPQAETAPRLEARPTDEQGADTTLVTASKALLDEHGQELPAVPSAEELFWDPLQNEWTRSAHPGPGIDPATGMDQGAANGGGSSGGGTAPASADPATAAPPGLASSASGAAGSAPAGSPALPANLPPLLQPTNAPPTSAGPTAANLLAADSTPASAGNQGTTAAAPPASGSALGAPAAAVPGAGTTVASGTGQGGGAGASNLATLTLMQNYGHLPLSFEHNQGQTDSQVQYLARGPGTTLFLTPTEAVLSLARPNAAATANAGNTLALRDISTDTVGMQFVGANPNVALRPEDELLSRSNYFTGSDANAWLPDVNQYGRVVYHDLYPGVDAVYYGNNAGQLEYDLVVAPGADPGAVHIHLVGAPQLQLDNQGNLLVTTASGGQLVQQAPVLYQTVDGARQAVSGRYQLTGQDLSFQVDSYDASQPLAIDPILNYSTYLGGSSSDQATSIAVDSQGNAYVAGITSSTNFPSQNANAGGASDAFVAKLNATGSALDYATYLGGSGGEQVFGIALDSANNAYVAGMTSSHNFPVTTGAFQTSTSNNATAAFVTKLSGAGDALLYSTYLSSSHVTVGAAASAIAVDAAGNAYVTGQSGDGFPTTVGAFQAGVGGGGGGLGIGGSAALNAFVTKVNSAGSDLVYSTFLGGSGSDAGFGVALDSQGDAFVTGQAESSDFPLQSPFQSTFGGTTAAFVSELNASGSGLVYSSYFGGNDTTGSGIAVDSSGNAYVTGSSSSSFTAVGSTASAYHGSSGKDAFVAEVSSAAALTYASYLGGSSTDFGNAIALDRDGNVFLTGQTSSMDMSTANALASGASLHGATDAFLVPLTPAAGVFLSTYLGGSGNDAGTGVAVDTNGIAYVAGWTSSTDFPTAGTPFEASNQGGNDVFVAKLTPTPGPAAPVFTAIATDTGSSSSDQLTMSQNLTLSGTAPAGSSVTVSRADLGVLGSTTASGGGTFSYDYTGTTLPEGNYTFTATDTLSGAISATSAPFPVIVDLTPPNVTLSVPSPTYDLSPLVTVTAWDLNGLPNTTLAAIDVDLNHNGNFTDTGERGYATGTLINGTVQITLPALQAAGATYAMQARVTDRAGNEGTSSTQSVQVDAVPTGTVWSISGGYLTSDPKDGQSQEQLGNLQVLHALDLDQSPGTSQGSNPALVYNSDSVNVRPIVYATVIASNSVALPSTISAQLIWNGTAQATQTYSTSGFSGGSSFTLAQQVTSAVTTTGRYGWSLVVTINLPTPIVATYTYASYVVVQDNSPFGAGWTFSPTDQLVSIAADSHGPAGELRVYGTGSWRFYTDAGGGSYTNPPGDNGTLAQSGGTFTYTRPDGTTETFNSAGYETSIVSPDGQEITTFTYNGSNQLTTMTAIDGAVSTFTYSGSKVASIATAGSRTFGLGYSGSNLTAVTNPDSGVHTFAYDANHHLTREDFGLLENNWAYASSNTLATLTWGNTSSPSVSKLSPAVVAGLSSLVDGTIYAKMTDALNTVTFDALNSRAELLVRAAANGSYTSWGRDSNGWITRATDADGHTTTYALDSAGYVTQQTEPDGSLVAYQYQSAFHALTTLIDERSGTTTSAYDSAGHRTSQTDPLGGLTTSTYLANGLLQAVTDADGHTTTYSYDADRRLSQETNPALGTIGYAYDSRGNPLTTTDALLRVTTTGYDVMGRLTQTQDALLDTTTLTYDKSGLLLTSTDARNDLTKTVYDTSARGLLAREADASGSGAEEDLLDNYNADGERTGSRDGNGNWTVDLVDSVGQETQITDASGGVTLRQFDRAGQVTLERDPLGLATGYQYDTKGEQTATVDPLGHVATTLYDRTGNVTSVTDALLHTTTYSYDLLGRQTSVQDALGNLTTTVYDHAGNVLVTIDALGHRTSYSYDALNRQTQVQDALGDLSTTIYDAVGNVLARINALGTRTSFAYDAADRQTLALDALGDRSTSIYDPQGNVVATVDARGYRSTQVYDALNRLVQTQDPQGDVTLLILDGDSNTTAQIDGRNDATLTLVDALNRPSVLLDGVGNLRRQLYDADGRLIDSIDERKDATVESYDQAGRQTSVQDALGNASTVVYDAVGNVLVQVDARGDRTTFSYDALNRQTQVQDAQLNLSTTIYDAAGNVAVTIDPRGDRTTFSYDALNRQTQVQDPAGDVSTVVFDAVGDQTVHVDALGQRTTYSFDALHRQTQVQDPAGDTTGTVFDADGNVAVAIDGLGRRTTYGYDAADRQTSVLDPQSNLFTTTYDQANNPTGQVDARTLRTTQLYDADNRVTAVQDALGDTTTTSYDAAGNVLLRVDALGRTTSYSYDALNRQTQVQDALGDLSTTIYDTAGNVLATVDALNRRTTFSYDTDNRRTQVQDALGDLSTTLYDKDGNQTVTVDALGRRTTYSYDTDNRQTQVQDALGDLTTTVYAVNGNVLVKIDALGDRSTYSYDTDNRQTQAQDALGNLTTTVYDLNGNRVATVDPLGHRTTYGFDTDNRQTSVQDALGNTTTTIYDTDNNVTALVDARGNRTSFAYDVLNRRTQTTDPFGNLSTVVYDAVGNQIRSIDRAGFTTTLSYDALNRLTATVAPSGGLSTVVYDAVGNRVNTIDANGDKSTFVYDALNRQTTSIDPVGAATTVVFDAVGNQVNEIDADGNKTTFVYDALNRRTQQVDPLGHGSSMAYDALNRQTSATDALGRVITSTFDADSRLTGQVWTSGGVTVNTFTFTYDAASNRLTAANNAGTYTLAYDADNRVTAVQELFGQSLTFAYDAASNRTLVQDSQGGTTTSVYDASNRLTSRQFGGPGQTPLRVDFTYTVRDQVATQIDYTNLAATQVADSATYTYDSTSRLSNLQQRNNTSTLFANYTYTYDAGDRVLTEVLNGTTTSYAYNAASELTTGGATNYSYDANGNRTMTGYATGTGNQLTNDGTWTYTYDAVDNLVQKAKAGNTEIVTYTYDNQNHLLSVADWTSTGTTLVQYKYDAFSNRVEEDVTPPGATLTATRFALDGWKAPSDGHGGQAVLQGIENWDTWGDFSSTNTLQTRYLHGDLIDQVFARVGSGGAAAWYWTDRLGSVRNVMSATGTGLETLAYDAYGNNTTDTNPSVGDRNRYAGGQYDSATGLNFDGIRVYDPHTGRWLTIDPKGFTAGDSNLDRYVRDNPTNATDPSGLALLAENSRVATDVYKWLTGTGSPDSDMTAAYGKSPFALTTIGMKEASDGRYVLYTRMPDEVRKALAQGVESPFDRNLLNALLGNENLEVNWQKDDKGPLPSSDGQRLGLVHYQASLDGLGRGLRPVVEAQLKELIFQLRASGQGRFRPAAEELELPLERLVYDEGNHRQWFLSEQTVQDLHKLLPQVLAIANYAIRLDSQIRCTTGEVSPGKELYLEQLTTEINRISHELAKVAVDSSMRRHDLLVENYLNTLAQEAAETARLQGIFRSVLPFVSPVVEMATGAALVVTGGPLMGLVGVGAFEHGLDQFDATLTGLQIGQNVQTFHAEMGAKLAVALGTDPADSRIVGAEWENKYVEMLGMAALLGGLAPVTGAARNAAQFEALAQRRVQLGLPAAGAAEDAATLARLEINGQTFNGINRGLQSPPTPMTLQRVNAQTITHAEADVVQQAVNGGMRGTARRAEMWVDRDPCGACGPSGGLRSLARNLGVDELIVHSPSGTQTFTPTR